jgi:hypothetical protein
VTYCSEHLRFSIMICRACGGKPAAGASIPAGFAAVLTSGWRAAANGSASAGVVRLGLLPHARDCLPVDLEGVRACRIEEGRHFHAWHHPVPVRKLERGGELPPAPGYRVVDEHLDRAARISTVRRCPLRRGAGGGNQPGDPDLRATARVPATVIACPLAEQAHRGPLCALASFSDPAWG